MFCRNCGNQVAGGSFCPTCGTNLKADAIAPKAPVLSGSPKVMGMIGMIMGIVSLVTSITGGGGLTFGIVGLILSIIASNQAAARGCENPNAKLGKKLSLAGIIVGVVLTVLAAVAIAVLTVASFAFEAFRFMAFLDRMTEFLDSLSASLGSY